MFGNASRKLRLNKETVRALSGHEMQGLVGGRLVASGASHGCTCTCKCEPTIVCFSKACDPIVAAQFAF